MRKTINGSPGLWTAPNSENAPPGALKQASGCMIRSAGIIEKMRPQRQYSLSAPGSLGYYGGRFISGYGNAIETATGAGTFSNTTPPFTLTAPETTSYIRSAEANGNYYIPTAAGYVKFDSVANNPYRAGVPRALDIQLTLVGSGSLLANTNSAGYRAVFGIKDANGNLILGPPSGRFTITATAAQDVSVKVWMHSHISGAANATSYFVQVYRTAVNVTASTDPGEDMLLVYQANLTSTDASNKYILFTDATPDALRGAAGYFCPGQEGVAQANYPPPIAIDTALFKGQTFYARTTQKHQARVQLLGVGKNLLTISTAAGGITKSGGNGVYTFTGSPDLTNIPTDGTAKLSAVNCTSAANNGEFPITGVNTGAFTITVTNAGAVTEAGTATARAFPSKLTIAGVNYYGVISSTAETPASQLFKVSTGYAISATGTPQQDVRDTAASLLRVVNQQSSPVVYGSYESGPDDGAGKMLFEAVSYGASSFTIAAVGTLFYNSFNPTIPSGALTSTNDSAANRLYYSKVSQPEHVPLGNYFDIGSRASKILRITALREALLIWKEDGLFRLTSDGAGNLAVAAFDYSAIAIRPEAVTTMAGRAYGACVNGITECTESSVRIISGPIANQIRPYCDQRANPYTSTMSAQAWSADIDLLVGFYFTNQGYSTTSSSDATVGLLYSVQTGAWTGLPTTELGTINYYGFPTITVLGVPYRTVFSSDNGIWYDDVSLSREHAFTGVGSNKGPLPAHKMLLPRTGGTSSTYIYDNTLAGAWGTPAVGSIIGEVPSSDREGKFSTVTVVSTVGSNTTLTLTAYGNSSANAGAGGATCCLLISQSATVEWVPFSGGDDGSYSAYQEVSVLLDGLGTLTAANVSAYTEATTSTAIAAFTSSNTPVATGTTGLTNLRCLLPGTMRRARRLSVVLTHTAVPEYLLIRGISFEFEDSDGHEIT